MDCIRIEHLEAYALIGTLPHERIKPQLLEIDAVLSGDFRAAGRSDDLSQAVDYSAAEAKIKDLAEHSCFQLLEALGEHLADSLLADPRIQSVRLRISKPAAPRFARAIILEIERP